MIIKQIREANWGRLRDPNSGRKENSSQRAVNSTNFTQDTTENISQMYDRSFLHSRNFEMPHAQWDDRAFKGVSSAKELKHLSTNDSTLFVIEKARNPPKLKYGMKKIRQTPDMAIAESMIRHCKVRT